MIISTQDATAELTQLGFRRVVGPLDRNLFCPSGEWLNEFAAWINLHRKAYEPEKYDCDDFAFWARHEATRSLVRNPVLRDCGHAFLFCTFYPAIMEWINGIEGSGDGHACNIVRTPDGWVFFEPQTGLFCPARPALERGAISLLDLVIV